MFDINLSLINLNLYDLINDIVNNLYLRNSLLRFLYSLNNSH